jgi:hypothetical protein
LLPLCQLDILLVYVTAALLAMWNLMDRTTRTDLVLHRPLGLNMIFLEFFAKLLQSFQVFDRNSHFFDFLGTTL